MNATDTVFAGSIPAIYDQFMVPLLFAPYAKLVAKRAAELRPRRILETAAGTGVVTEELLRALPDAEIVATDLNAPMLEQASRRIEASKLRFQPADAQLLPFDNDSFDLVVCQFGVMFYPDKVQGNREARRVLRDGGRYLIAIWDAIERNPMSALTQQTMIEQFPDNPPMFMRRGPFSYYEPGWIERDLKAAGFSNVDIDTVTLTSRSGSAEEATRGLCYGSPMRVELEEYGRDALDSVYAVLSKSARRFEGASGFEAPMSAHIVTAIK